MTDQTAAGLAEPSTVAYLVTGLARGEPSICFEDERGDYGDEDHMPIFEALVRKSDYAALVAQLEEQRAVSARMERNRDMWKGQCERQAEQLTAFRMKGGPHADQA